MNVQEIILVVVLLICVVWIVRRTWVCFKRVKRGNNPCDGCPCGCNTRKKPCS